MRLRAVLVVALALGAFGAAYAVGKTTEDGGDADARAPAALRGTATGPARAPTLGGVDLPTGLRPARRPEPAPAAAPAPAPAPSAPAPRPPGPGPRPRPRTGPCPRAAARTGAPALL